MTNYIILAFCIIILLSYIFDITGKYTKVPGVVLLIALGILLHLLTDSIGLKIPNLKPLLPVIGTLGLILIIMEASFDLSISRDKKELITGSVSSALILLFLTVSILSISLIVLVKAPVKDAILNSIPLSIISSAVAIASAGTLEGRDREFVIYESSFSDIFGIILFDYILLSKGTFFNGLVSFTLSTILTLIIAIVVTAILAILLHKTKHHVNYVIILTAVILVYIIAKMVHLPALLLVLSFGLILSNNQFLQKTPVAKFVDFGKFRNDLASFKTILTEMTFLVRSFFFLVFGFYIKIDGLLDPLNLLFAISIIVFVFGLRFLFFLLVLKKKPVPLVFFSPRGLITILLFLSIPEVSAISLVSEELITLVILFSILLLTFGNIIHQPDAKAPEL